jgi:hypothetical protein
MIERQEVIRDLASFNSCILCVLQPHCFPMIAKPAVNASANPAERKGSVAAGQRRWTATEALSRRPLQRPCWATISSDFSGFTERLLEKPLVPCVADARPQNAFAIAMVLLPVKERPWLCL